MRSIWHTTLAAGLWLAASPVATALDAPRKVVDYDVEVTLQAEERQLRGAETLRWTNPSDVQVGELKFHLYWNAFRNNRSTFFKESGGRLRSDAADKDKGWGSIDVSSMTWNGQDLLPGSRFESPDDGNPDDRTVLSVALPRPVEPGETIELRIGWTGRFPKVFARAGYVRDFFFAGQWFPKIGVFEPRGVRGRSDPGWNCHQYHAHSEFYADFGDYRVAITVPERFVVASAGALVKESRAGGQKTLVFEQKAIHDFAWTADPRYVVKEDVFEPARDVPPRELARAARILGRRPEDLLRAFRPVKLRFYMQPDHEPQWVRYADAQKWALAWFGLYAFPYPYAQVSCIDPPEDGTGAAGMEYQTLYTAGTARLLGRWPFDKIRLQEMVVVHEFGHGYWYGLLASNEFEESWMDEGINTFTEYEMMDTRYRYVVELPFGVGLSDEDVGRVATLAGPETDPIRRPAWGYASANSYGRNSYQRPATVIFQLRRLLGEERFWRALRAYAERWRYDHPASRDFLDAMQAFADRDLSPFFEETWSGRGTIDFRVISASSKREEKLTGWDDGGKPVGFLPGAGKKSRKEVEADRKEEKKMPWVTRVTVGRSGTIVMPVDVVLTFENGRTHRTTWDGKAEWLRLSTTYGSRLVKVEIDPDRKVVLDASPWNNARYLDGWKGPSAAAKVRTYALHALQIVLSTLCWGLA